MRQLVYFAWPAVQAIPAIALGTSGFIGVLVLEALMDNTAIQERFLDILREADDAYFGIDLWEHAQRIYPQIYKNHPKRRKLKQYLARYGERVFCYELYHQIRSHMERIVCSHEFIFKLN